MSKLRLVTTEHIGSKICRGAFMGFTDSHLGALHTAALIKTKQEPDIAVQCQQLLLCANDSVLLYSQSQA